MTRRAVVSGGGTGIGRAVAQRLAAYTDTFRLNVITAVPLLGRG
ncbi:hypothetical protein [Nocardia sp. NBC_01388]